MRQWLHRMVSGAKSRAQDEGMPFDLDNQMTFDLLIAQNFGCAL